MFIFLITQWIKLPMKILYFKLGSIQQIFHFYKSLQILVNFYNQLFSKTFVSIQVGILSICSVTTSFEAIKWFNKLPIIAYGVFPNSAICCITCLLLAMNFMSKMYEYSKDFKVRLIWFLSDQQFKGSQLEIPKCQLKQLRGIYYLRCYVNNFYFVKKTTKRVFLSFLIGTIINWIITF